MLAKIEQLLQEIEGLQASNAEELEALRIKYLSKKGAINELMADFRNVPAEQKKGPLRRSFLFCESNSTHNGLKSISCGKSTIVEKYIGKLCEKFIKT